MKWYSSQKKHSIGYESLEVDFHNHLIPGVDDGVQTVGEATEMLRRFSAMGYRKVITTPHINSDMFDNDEAQTRQGLAIVQQALKDEGIAIELEAAAEYYINMDFLEKAREKPLLTFGQGYILIETSFHTPPTALETIVFELQSLNYELILAHPERYPYWYKQLEQYETLINRNVHLQINLPSLAGFYGKKAQRVAETLLKNDWVDFVGTDAHTLMHLNAAEKALKNKHLQHALEKGRFRNPLL